MPFTQTMTVEAEAAEPLADLVDAWHREQSGVAPGYQGARVLADAERSGRYVIEVDFSSEEEAAKNNDRAETSAWAKRLDALVRGEPTYSNFAVVHSTG